jgi:hypothetical protein
MLQLTRNAIGKNSRRLNDLVSQDLISVETSFQNGNDIGNERVEKLDDPESENVAASHVDR